MNIGAFYDVNIDAFYGDDDKQAKSAPTRNVAKFGLDQDDFDAYEQRKAKRLAEAREAFESATSRPRKVNPFKREKPITREEFWGIGPQPEPKAKRKTTNLNEPTYNWCKRKGWSCQLVERYDARFQRKFDLYGFVDFLASDGSGTVAIQSTTRDNMSARIKKIQGSKHLRTVQEMGWKVLVLGFYKDDRGHWAAKETYI